jgi:outer membrane protein TolC
VRLALEEHPRVLADREEIRAGELEVWSARFRLGPRATVTSRVTRVDQRTYDVANASLEGLRALLEAILPGREFDIEPFLYRDTYQTTIQVEQPIFNGGRLWAGLRAARRSKELAEVAYRETRLEVAYRVREAFYRHLEALALERIAQRALEAARERLQAARDAYKAGQRRHAEVLRWEVFVSQREAELVQARSATSLTLSALNEAMGQPLDRDWTLQEDPAEEERLRAAYGQLDLETYRQRVLAQSPLWRQAQLSVELAETQEQVARGGLLPSLNAFLEYGWHTDDDLALDDYNTWRATLALSYPLDPVQVTEYRKARAQTRRARYATDQLRNQLLLQATQRFLEARTAAQTLELRRTARDQARETLRLVSDAYAAGLATNLDLMDAQVAYDQAETAWTSARYDLILAWSRMAALDGTL